jgi:hypothetical protein
MNPDYKKSVVYLKRVLIVGMAIFYSFALISLVNHTLSGCRKPNIFCIDFNPSSDFYPWFIYSIIIIFVFWGLKIFFSKIEKKTVRPSAIAQVNLIKSSLNYLVYFQIIFVAIIWLLYLLKII